MKKPAVFIDRDGTINEQMGYINHIDRFKILPGVPEAIKLLNRNNFYAIIVTNQSGIARGYFPISLVNNIHSYLKESIARYGAILMIFFSVPIIPVARFPNTPENVTAENPEPGL